MAILDSLYDHVRLSLGSSEETAQGLGSVFYAGEELSFHEDDYVVIQELDTRRLGVTRSRRPTQDGVEETLALFNRSRFRVQFVGNLAGGAPMYALHCERYPSLAGGASVLVEGSLDADIDQDTPRRVVTVGVEHALTQVYTIPTFTSVDAKLALGRGVGVEYLVWNGKTVHWNDERLDYVARGDAVEHVFVNAG